MDELRRLLQVFEALETSSKFCLSEELLNKIEVKSTYQTRKSPRFHRKRQFSYENFLNVHNPLKLKILSCRSARHEMDMCFGIMKSILKYPLFLACKRKRISGCRLSSPEASDSRKYVCVRRL